LQDAFAEPHRGEFFSTAANPSGMLRWLDRWQQPRLTRKARRCLEQGHYRQARSLAERLRWVKNWQGWEIGALVERADGDASVAESLLTEGLRLYPQQSRLHQLLGNTRAEQGDYGEALAAYGRAQEWGGDPDWLAYLRARLWVRQEQWQRALEECPKEPANPEVASEIRELRLQLLSRLELLPELLQELHHLEQPSARAHYLGACAHQALGNQDAAVRHALEALKVDFSAGPEVQALLERVCDPSSLNSRRFLIRSEGSFRRKSRGPKPIRGGVSILQVVADNREEALKMYRQLEMPEIVRDFQLRRCEDRGPCPGSCKGLFGQPRRIFY